MNKQTLLMIILGLVILIAVLSYFYFKAEPQTQPVQSDKKQIETSDSEVPVSMPVPNNPLEDMPETINPMENIVNPLEDAVNPFKDTYKNPFAK